MNNQRARSLPLARHGRTARRPGRDGRRQRPHRARLGSHGRHSPTRRPTSCTRRCVPGGTFRAARDRRWNRDLCPHGPQHARGRIVTFGSGGDVRPQACTRWTSRPASAALVHARRVPDRSSSASASTRPVRTHGGRMRSRHAGRLRTPWASIPRTGPPRPSNGFAPGAGPRAAASASRTATRCLLLDESYNASAACRAGRARRCCMACPPRRRVAVLGDMLELGVRSAEAEHAGPRGGCGGQSADMLYACGPLTPVPVRPCPARPSAAPIRRTPPRPWPPSSPPRSAPATRSSLRAASAAGCALVVPSKPRTSKTGAAHPIRSRAKCCSTSPAASPTSSPSPTCSATSPSAPAPPASPPSCSVGFMLGPTRHPLAARSVQRGGQPIREDGPARHLVEKKGTPTMGGVLILLSLTISTLLWADLRERLRLGRAAADPRLRRHRLHRRLPEAVPPQHQGRVRARQAGGPAR